MRALVLNHARFSAQLDAMLKLQEQANLILFPDWDKRGLAWHRAIYTETSELIEHLGQWKWWKKGKTDLFQAQMELIDIWHFGMSWAIERFGQPVGSESLNTAILRRVERGAELSAQEDNVGDEASVERRHNLIDDLVMNAGGRLFSVETFVRLLALCEMDFDDLFRLYIAKNALNRFRWTHGYREGTYVKVWAGEEDNVHLERELQAAMEQGVEPDALLQHVLDRVEVLYKTLNAAA